MESENTRKKIVILGHTGFLGSNFSKHLRENPAYEVNGISSIQVDLSSRELTLSPEFINHDVTVIMAASALAKKKDPLSFQKEISIFINLAGSALLSKIGHFILISSTAIYGRHSNLAITELSRPVPNDLYSYAKLIGELIFKHTCAANGIPLTIIRPGIVYGQGDIRSPLFKFVSNVRLGKEIEMSGNCFTRLPFVYNKDLCRIIELICQHSKIGDYNVVSCGIPLIELAEFVFRACRLRTGIKFLESKTSPSLIFDISKFRVNFPGFKFTGLEDGIKDYFDDSGDISRDQI